MYKLDEYHKCLHIITVAAYKDGKEWITHIWRAAELYVGVTPIILLFTFLLDIDLFISSAFCLLLVMINLIIRKTVILIISSQIDKKQATSLLSDKEKYDAYFRGLKNQDKTSDSLY